MDHETDVYADQSQTNGVEYYHCSDKREVSNGQKFKKKKKFSKKFLVWQAMDEMGNVSKPFICEGTINKGLYLEECLKKILFFNITKLKMSYFGLIWLPATMQKQCKNG